MQCNLQSVMLLVYYICNTFGKLILADGVRMYEFFMLQLFCNLNNIINNKAFTSYIHSEVIFEKQMDKDHDFYVILLITCYTSHNGQYCKHHTVIFI